LTAGESHGPAVTVIIEGIPAGLKVDTARVNLELRRRQFGYGRGKRMHLERDTATVSGGLWRGHTNGGPVSITIRNRDWTNWKDRKPRKQQVPRPGHADLPGVLKYDLHDIQAVIERSSARETAARTAAGAVAKQLLAHLGVEVHSHTLAIGSVRNDQPVDLGPARIRSIERSAVRCADATISKQMIREIDRAVDSADTLGGVAEIVTMALPVGLGSYAQWDRRADSRLAAAIMSVQSVKAVEIGDGIESAALFGSTVHDPIERVHGVYQMPTNSCGGILGGVTTGGNVVIRAFFKPISTLGNPLPSVNMKTGKPAKAPVVRSDICVVPAGGVICEAVTALVFADLVVAKFGGDSLRELLANYRTYNEHVRKR
jgi:chorismate synthase